MRPDRGAAKELPIHAQGRIFLATQIDFLDSCCPAELCRQLAYENVHSRDCALDGEPGFGEIESDVLFAFVATKKPRQIFQIGCGVSTAICLMAAAHVGYRPQVICVDPYPTNYLVDQDRQGNISLLRLKAQAWVHFHDVFFPSDYPRDALTTLFFTHESVLVHAFLAYNSRFRVAASLSMLHYHGREHLAGRFPRYRPAADDHGLARSQGHFPSSLYLNVVA